jgi:filamentous hemagglutinin
LAALSPDLLKAIDPTGAALTSGQQAAMAGFATLLGGGLAGLAGANAQGGVTAAENEVLNNTDNHPEDAAKNGGILSTLSDTFVNALTAFSAARSQGQSQFLQLIQSGANHIISEPHLVQAAQGINNGMAAAPDAGGGPTAGPDLAPAEPAGGTGQLPSPAASQSSSSNTPSNSLLSNGSSDSGSGNSNGEGATNTGKVIIDGKIAGQQAAVAGLRS